MRSKTNEVYFDNQLSSEFNSLSSRKITLSSIGTTSRVFQYLKSKELIDYNLESNDEKREWVKLNYFEAFWLVLVQEFRKFGMPDKRVRDIKSYLFESFIHKIGTGFEPLTYSDYYLEMLGLKPQDGEFGLSAHQLFLAEQTMPEDEKPFFTNLAVVLSVLLMDKGNPVMILSPKDDKEGLKVEVFATVLGDDVPNKILESMAESKMIIPLRTIFGNVFESKVETEILLNYRLISDKEKKVLDVIESGDFKELTIKRKGKDLVLKVKTDGEISGEDVRTLRRILGTNDYNSVNLKYRNDKYTYFECDQEIKL